MQATVLLQPSGACSASSGQHQSTRAGTPGPGKGVPVSTTETLNFERVSRAICLPRPVCVNRARTVARETVRPAIDSIEQRAAFVSAAGGAPETFAFSTRIFDLPPRPDDEVLVRSTDSGLPLIVRRGDSVLVNFDLDATRSFSFQDSKRPVYTYLPGFNIHMVPERIRRPISNLVHGLRAAKRLDVTDEYRRLPLNGFESALLLITTALNPDAPGPPQVFRWPAGKRAVFLALHDVDTPGFLQRRERDPLFRIEAKHDIHATWFIPTYILNRGQHAIDFVRASGGEVGWHGHKHDHRDHQRPFADRAVNALRNSRLIEGPFGMRLPRLLKSNYLFGQLEGLCPTLCYDTSFLSGIAPYPLCVDGRPSRILEIPTTVPTDIRVYNELGGLRRTARADAILKAQIARTEKLISVGAVVSIVTHPEKALSERKDFLEIYDQYLAYIRSRSDLWLATATELFAYWTEKGAGIAGPSSRATRVTDESGSDSRAFEDPAASAIP